MTNIPTLLTDPVIAPSAVSAFRSVPYITPSWWKAAPTATAAMPLLPNAQNSQAASLASLAQVISRASAYMDEFVFHDNDGMLASFQKTEGDWYTVKPDGSIVLICNLSPVRQVLGVAVGPTANQVSSLTSGDGISIGLTTITLPPTWGNGLVGPMVFAGWPSYNGRVYCTYTYSALFPHAALAPKASPMATFNATDSVTVSSAANIAVGDPVTSSFVPAGTTVAGIAGTTLTLSAAATGSGSGTLIVGYPAGSTSLNITPAAAGEASMTGAVAGMPLTIKDPLYTETVLLASTPTTTALSLSSGTAYPHWLPAAPDGMHITAIPDSIEQAAISLTNVLVKTQGYGGMTLPKGSGAPSSAMSKAMGRAGVTSDYEAACEFLRRYKSVYVH